MNPDLYSSFFFEKLLGLVNRFEYNMLAKGIYQHYKGQMYQVLHVATHSETREELVVYQCLYGDYSIWVRPLSMFTEMVTLEDDREIERFKLVNEL